MFLLKNKDQCFAKKEFFPLLALAHHVKLLLEFRDKRTGIARLHKMEAITKRTHISLPVQAPNPLLGDILHIGSAATDLFMPRLSMLAMHAVPFVLHQYVSMNPANKVEMTTYHSTVLIARIDVMRHRQYACNGCCLSYHHRIAVV